MPTTDFSLPRSWYVVPYYSHMSEETGQLDDEGIGYVDGSLQIVRAIVTERPLQIQAYDRPSRVLVGTFGALSVVPNGWRSLSVDEARTLFKNIKGRDPTDAEVS